MLIQISENRWIAEPEAVFRGMKPDTPDPGRYTKRWVARMPSGTLEWLTDEEYEKLHDAFTPTFTPKPYSYVKEPDYGTFTGDLR